MSAKHIVSALLLSAVCTTSALAAGPTFQDVSQEDFDWAYEAIEEFAARGIVNGVSEGVFDPDGSVTREQLCKMLLLAFDLSPAADTQSSFADVAEGAWSRPYIEVAKVYLPGDDSSGTALFRPREAATREDIAAALVRALDMDISSYTGDTLRAAFSDSGDIADDLSPYVEAAYSKGLIQGFEDGTFLPHDSVTRAQAVVMLSRALQLQETQPTASILCDVPESVDTPTLEVSGSIQDGPSGGVTKVTVNSETAELDANGTFRALVTLSEGENTLRITATLADASTVERELSVTYTPITETVSLTLDKLPSVYSAIQPLTVTGTATGEGITVTVNGKTATVSENGHFSVQIDLETGENTLTAIATDKNGKTAQQSATVTKQTSTGGTSADAYEIDDFYGYVLEDPYASSVDGTKVSAFRLWDGEQERAMRLVGNLPDFKEGAVIEYTLMSDGSLKRVHAVHGAVCAIVEIADNGRKVMLAYEDGQGEFEITEDTTVLFVDTEEGTGEAGTLQTADKRDGQYLANAWFSVYGDKLDCLVMDINNEWNP